MLCIYYMDGCIWEWVVGMVEVRYMRSEVVSICVCVL